MKTKLSAATIAQFSVMLAIEALFCFSPLGSIPFSPTIVATLGMLPVIVTAVLMGLSAGAAMGFFAGLFSFLVWTYMPPNPVFAFVFTPFYSMGDNYGNFGSILICFVPRIAVGIVAYFSYRALSKKFPSKPALCYAIAAALGSLANTVGVLGGIWLFFGNQYATAAGSTILYVIGFLVLTNGLPEAAVSAVVTPLVATPIRKVTHL